MKQSTADLLARVTNAAAEELATTEQSLTTAPQGAAAGPTRERATTIAACLAIGCTIRDVAAAFRTTPQNIAKIHERNVLEMLADEGQRWRFIRILRAALTNPTSKQ